MPHPPLQPNAVPIDRELVAAILAHQVDSSVARQRFALEYRGEYSNDVARVRLADGRSLMVKRARYEWAGPRFRTARLAARQLRQQAGIIAPETVPVPPGLDGRPLDVYWWIDLPTLAELWPELDRRQQRGAMHSLGELVQRTHAVRFEFHGDIGAPEGRGPFLPLLRQDLERRLGPAAAGLWPEGLPAIAWLSHRASAVARRVSEQGSLLHGDLHTGNVLCERHSTGEVHCVGMLDLEWAQAGPPESDLARMAVIQTRLFQMPLTARWFHWTVAGYGRDPDPVVLGYYAVYHLVQLGYYSASIGHTAHARRVAAAASRTLAAAREVETELEVLTPV